MQDKPDRSLELHTRISAGETAMDETVDTCVMIQRTRTPRASARSHPPTPDVFLHAQVWRGSLAGCGGSVRRAGGLVRDTSEGLS